MEAMSSRSVRRVPSARPAQRSMIEWDHLRYAMILIFFLMVWFFPNPNAVSFREDPGAGREGTLLVQLLWFGLLGLAILSVQDRWRDVARQVDLTMILMLAWCAMTVPLALLPDVSMRRYIFTVVGLFAVTIGFTSPKRPEAVLWILLGVLVAETIAKYTMVFAFPSLGRHGFLGLEPQLNGLWRGQFAHKNIAGPVCILELFILYAARGRVAPFYLILLAIPQVIFLIMAGSKTPLFLSLIVVLLAKYVLRNKTSIGVLLPVMGAVIAINLITVGSTVSPFIHMMAQRFIGDVSFTGRTDLWYLLLRYIGDNPLIGAGFLSFWQVGTLTPAAQDGSTWTAQATYGHQGYLDLAATIGVPGLALTLLFIVLRPCLDVSAIRNRANPLLEMYVCFWLFGLLHNGTETNILGRADNVWLFMVLGIAGVRRCLIDDVKTIESSPTTYRQSDLVELRRRTSGYPGLGARPT